LKPDLTICKAGRKFTSALYFGRLRNRYNHPVSPAAASAHDEYLLACVAGTVALLLLFVGRLRVHAAVGLSVAALALGVAAGIPLEKVPLLFTAGAGDMMGHIAIILGMGAILGQLLASSGAAAALGAALVERCGAKGMPWALLCLGLLVGLPVFFEVGLVLMLPVIVDAARRSGRPPIVVSLPVLAGLSIMHGLVPPHPGALLAATVYHATLASVMLWGIVAGVPAAVLAGPVLEAVLVRMFGRSKKGFPAGMAARGAMIAAAPVSKSEPALGSESSIAGPAGDDDSHLPAPAGALGALVVILLPVALILVGGWADSLSGRGSVPNQLLHLAGYPDVAMVIAALVALVILGGRVQERAYRVRGGLRRLTADSFMPIAGPLVILAAAGGLSGELRASGAAQAAVTLAMGAHMPPILLAWALAAAVRVSMGSATVATAVASGILAPMAGTMGVRPELLVLATGSGALILSHVNDSGFWLVSSLFKIDVKTTLATWSVLETVLSVAGLAFTLLLAAALK
jgi:gluconate:H+ symporter, GntP family